MLTTNGDSRRILEDLSKKANSEFAQMKAELERLKAENAKLKSKGSGNGLKVSAKGAVSIYGYGRWPITIYPKVLLILLGERRDELLAFIDQHKDELSWSKDD